MQGVGGDHGCSAGEGLLCNLAELILEDAGILGLGETRKEPGCIE